MLIFIACLLAVFAFQYIGLLWSFADFHPGGDVESDAELTHRAELGSALHSPFRIPMKWMTAFTIRLTGGYDFVSSSTYATVYGVAHWFILPLIYATVIAFVLCPLTVSLRARLEGLVAYKEKPGLFLVGQLVYLVALTVSGCILSALKFPGNLLGPLGFIAANVTTACVFHYLLISSRQLRKLQKTVTAFWKG